MLPQIPRPGDFDVSPEHGFLPAELPLQCLDDPYYRPWESTVGALQALILTRRLRGVVDALPVLSTDYLDTEPEWRRAYSILAFIAHAYIWGGDTPVDVSSLLLGIVLALMLMLHDTESPSFHFRALPLNLSAPRASPRSHLCWSSVVELAPAGSLSSN